MSISGKDIDRAWKKLGMEIKDTGDRHALFKVDGRLILRTKRSFGAGDIGGQIPHFIRQQMKLDNTQFQNLLNCPLDRPGYIEILKDKGLISPIQTDPSSTL